MILKRQTAGQRNIIGEVIPLSYRAKDRIVVDANAADAKHQQQEKANDHHTPQRTPEAALWLLLFRFIVGVGANRPMIPALRGRRRGRPPRTISLLI